MMNICGTDFNVDVLFIDLYSNYGLVADYPFNNNSAALSLFNGSKNDIKIEVKFYCIKFWYIVKNF